MKSRRAMRRGGFFTPYAVTAVEAGSRAASINDNARRGLSS
jgi:hypothetical protein